MSLILLGFTIFEAKLVTGGKSVLALTLTGFGTLSALRAQPQT